MRLPLSWLREFCDPGVEAEALAERLTMAGLEVERIERLGEGLDGVVVGEVRAVRPHPAAARLRLCEVDDGGALRPIVCGAENVRPGLKAPLALPGAVLP
ncbi:MAG: phenylalanine--tRNA ligase subunit beta, partial [Polyangiaceae bacterium]|nr:phenylalanine--tRNA ligase subunit beta [Polyangiaceae bacterium]